MRDVKVLGQLVDDFSIVNVGWDFLGKVPIQFYSEDQTSEELDIILSNLFSMLQGRESHFVPLIESTIGDYNRLNVIYRPMISAYSKSSRVVNDFGTSPINQAYFWFILSKHLSNRIINETCEFLVYYPRDFHHQIERVENLLVSTFERWDNARKSYSGNRIYAIIERTALDSFYIPVGLVLLWIYAELKELDSLAHNLPAPKVGELYLKFPFDPERNDFKKNLADLNERLIKRFFNYFEYSKEKAVHLILGAQDKLKADTFKNTPLLENADFKNNLESQIARLQVLVFLKEYCHYTKPIPYDLLDDIKFVTSIRYQQQSISHKRIVNEKLPLEKLMQLNTDFQQLEESFSPISLSSLIESSGVGQFYKYLNQQRDLLEAQNSKPELAGVISPTISFKFTGNKMMLKKSIDELCNEICLLDERQSSRAYLLHVLTTDDITTCQQVIALTCETKQFNYIILKLAPFFENQLIVSIGDCNLFLSKQKKKITTSNLRNTKNPSDVKEKQIIDRILKHLQ